MRALISEPFSFNELRNKLYVTSGERGSFSDVERAPIRHSILLDGNGNLADRISNSVSIALSSLLAIPLTSLSASLSPSSSSLQQLTEPAPSLDCRGDKSPFGREGEENRRLRFLTWQWHGRTRTEDGMEGSLGKWLRSNPAQRP